MSLFSKAEADRIAATITEVEQRTAGEIVVAEVVRSDDYPEVRLSAAIAVALLGASVVHLVFPRLQSEYLLLVQFAAGILTWLVAALPAVLRTLSPRTLSGRKVERAAELAFLEHAVFRTRDRTGVLIFLSALEHRVVILGDEGIHARLQEAGWSELVSHIVRAIKEQRAGDGVCEVIRKLGEALSRDVPIREDDQDELDNRVRGPAPRA